VETVKRATPEKPSEIKSNDFFIEEISEMVTAT
jgi:hypothetical protein